MPGSVDRLSDPPLGLDGPAACILRVHGCQGHEGFEMERRQRPHLIAARLRGGPGSLRGRALDRTGASKPDQRIAGLPFENPA